MSPEIETPAPEADAGHRATHEIGSAPRAGAAVLLGSAALAACGGGGSAGTTQAPTPPPLAPPPPLTPPPSTITAQQSSRFLAQATTGASKADITALSNSSFDAWLNTQFAMARPTKFWDWLVANGYNVPANQNNQTGFDPMMWSQIIGAADTLRQRVGLALLTQWVVSIDGITGSFRQFAMAAYLDILWDNAFGNYRDLMEQVSTNVAMGLYLTFLGSGKANPATGSVPDENYARELMQLFTIGLYQLNDDGTQVLSSGKPVETYSQADVSGLARVWTGYVYASNDGSTPDRTRAPMAINANQHETGASTFLGISVPAGNDGPTSRRIALDGIFAHPNLPPFVSKQLIQHLVTSNPSPAYVGRVSAVFRNNGSGVRGDMKSVIRAILTDSEARADTTATTTFGKLREPVLRLTQWARAFGVTSPTNLWPFGNTNSTSNRLGQSPGRAPSVFNFFRPGYTPPGTAVADGGLVAPEFQITNEPQVVAYVNYMQTLIANGAGEAKPDYSALASLASDSQALLNELNLVLAAGQISAATIAQMKAALDSIGVSTQAGITNRITTAILLVMASPEYLVLK